MKPTGNFARTIDNVLEYNCAKLHIKKPKVEIVPYSAEIFSTFTTQAVLSSDGKEILINQRYWDDWCERGLSQQDIWFILTHECRHAWQLQDEEYLEAFKAYQKSGNLPLDEYNSQPAEVDAWAWTVYITKKVLRKFPTLEKNLGKEVWQKILDRIEQITPPPSFMKPQLAKWVKLNDRQKIVDALKADGWFQLKDNKKTKHMDLQAITRSEVAEAHTPARLEGQPLYFCMSYSEDIPKAEQLGVIWFEILELVKNSPFDDGEYDPKEVMLWGKDIGGIKEKYGTEKNPYAPVGK